VVSGHVALFAALALYSLPGNVRTKPGADTGPSGRAGDLGLPKILSSPKFKNISLYQNSDLRYQSAVPGPSEGRFAIVTTRWAGDAMDAAASGGFIPAGRKRRGVRRSRVVLAPRPWRQVGAVSPTPATVAKEAAHRGEHV
jgi:hypothetical protein